MTRPGDPPFEEAYFREAYGSAYEARNPPRKLAWYLARIREARPGGTLLDVGCAYGLFASAASRFYEVTGCDVSAHAVREAAARFPSLRFVRAGIGELELGAEFDVVTCFDVLEHVEDLPGALDRLRRHMKTGGVAAITVPVYDTLAGRVAGRLDRDPTHVWKKGRSFWRSTVTAHRFRILGDYGMWRYFLLGRRYIFFGGEFWRNFSPALLLIGEKG